MKIALIVEGRTEKAFLPSLRGFLQPRLPGRMPRFDIVPCNGPIRREKLLRRDVERLLKANDHVVALTDVYTGDPRLFDDAANAKSLMREWVGHESRFHPHAAQFDFEAWLLPYWPVIQRLAGSSSAKPSQSPERVNHTRPPSARLKEVFLAGSKGRDYVKTREAARILDGQDLLVSANACPELKALLNTFLRLCGGELIP